MKSDAGQTSLELLIRACAIVIVVVALSLYIRYASAGRIKAFGSGMSDVLFDSETSRTTWEVPGQTTVDTTEIVGGVRASPGNPGTAGVPIRTTSTPPSGLTRRTDELQ